MTASVTVFTYGDPDPAKAERIGAYLLGAASPFGVILGQSSGAGEWGGEAEACGSLVVSGLLRSQAVAIASRAAGIYEQDAVGVIHNDDGRTLAVPGSPGLHTAEEVWPT